jgi:hypothetical protein
VRLQSRLARLERRYPVATKGGSFSLEEAVWEGQRLDRSLKEHGTTARAALTAGWRGPEGLRPLRLATAAEAEWGLLRWQRSAPSTP